MEIIFAKNGTAAADPIAIKLRPRIAIYSLLVNPNINNPNEHSIIEKVNTDLIEYLSKASPNGICKKE